MSDRITSFVLVGLQFFCLGAIAASGPIFARLPALLAVEVLGLLLGAWAIVAMRLGNFNITPDIFENGTLATHGPYRLIRHPMYSALLLVTITLLIDSFSPVRALVWGVLFATLVIKLLFEERLLCDHFPPYSEYSRKTKRLIPYVF